MFNLKDELIVIFTSLLPISELRGAIPLAIFKFKFPLWKAFILSIIGNTIPVIFLIFFLEIIEKNFSRIKFLNKIFDSLKKRALKRKKIYEKYEIFGIYIFVAIPLPFTGAWTGCLLSYLLKLNPLKAFISIFFGIITAGLVVSLIITVGIKFGILSGILFGILFLFILNLLTR